MTESPKPEPDWGMLLKTYGKYYLQFMSLVLEKGIQQFERTSTVQPGYRVANHVPSTPLVKRERMRVVKPKPRKDLGILGWLKGPKVEERKN
jgi:hypothetical protein